MSVYDITDNETSTLQIVDGDEVTVESGASIIDPSYGMHSVSGMTNTAGIRDGHGGNNTILVDGTSQGFVGAIFLHGSNSVEIGDGGLVKGSNAGVEFHDLGSNSLVVDSGGELFSNAYSYWEGPTPGADPTTLPNSGNNTIINYGLMESDRRYMRLDHGGDVVNNYGTIQSNFEQAIQIDGSASDTAETINNYGTIQSGPRGPAILGGGNIIDLLNNGTIIGNVDLSSSNDIMGGNGVVSGTVFGNAGDDILIGGPGNDTFNGGLGADFIHVGAGVNTVIYTDVSESTGSSIDTLDRFSFNRDHLVVNGVTLTTFDALTGPDSLQGGHTGVFTDSGTTYLVVDENGLTGYQAGSDYEIILNLPLHLTLS